MKLEDVILAPDTLANQPAANSVPVGTLYTITDSSPANQTQRSNGATWDDYAPSTGGSGTVTNTGTLTSGKAIVGNGGVDVTVSSLTAQFVGSSSGTQAAASMTTARLLGRTTASSGAVEEITVGTGLSLSAGALTATGGSDGLVLLEQHTASASASLDFTTCISSTYDDYCIELVNVIPATDGQDFSFQVSTDGGSSYVTGSNYRYNGLVAGGGTSIDAANPATAISVTYGPADVDSGSNWGINGTLYFKNPASTTAYKGLLGHVHYMTNEATPTLANYWPSGLYVSTTAVNAFRFLFSSGNIASGTIRVYGLAK